MPERDALLIAAASTRSDHQMEGGLQQGKTTLIVGQHHARRIRQENAIAKTGRIRPKTN